MSQSKQQRHSGKPRWMNMCPGRVNFTFIYVTTHPPCSQEYNQSNPMYVAHTNRGLGHTKIVWGEYGNVVVVLGIDLKFSK